MRGRHRRLRTNNTQTHTTEKRTWVLRLDELNPPKEIGWDAVGGGGEDTGGGGGEGGRENLTQRILEEERRNERGR